MNNIIYTVQFHCELCKKEIIMPVHGNVSPPIILEEKQEFIDWCRHYHWIDYHRICAICGKLVNSGELELLENDGKVKIHKDYTDEYERIRRGDRYVNLLIVHNSCIKN